MSISDLGFYMMFAGNLITAAVHTPPGLEMDFAVDMLGMRLYYRFESLACALLLPRFVEVWRYLMMASVDRYFNVDDSYAVGTVVTHTHTNTRSHTHTHTQTFTHTHTHTHMCVCVCRKKHANMFTQETRRWSS